MQEIVDFVQGNVSRPLAIFAMMLVAYLIVRQFGSDIVERVKKVGLADGPTAQPSLERLRGFSALQGPADFAGASHGTALPEQAHVVTRWDLKQWAGGTVFGITAATSLFFAMAGDEPAYFLNPRNSEFVEFTSMKRCQDFAATINGERSKAGLKHLCYLK